MATPLTRGVLIAFEGIDGAGKTTQARSLGRWLRASGFDVVESKEPTNGPWGQRLRASAETGRLSPSQELELFVADRREHVEQLIRPALDAHRVVIVDRYYFSTAAYQGARGMNAEEILELNERFAPQPDLLFLLRVDPDTGRARIASRGDRANLFEDADALAASAAIFDNIQRPYLRRISGHLSIGEIESTVLYVVGELLESLVVRPAVGQAPDAAAALEHAARIISDDTIKPEDKPLALLARLR